MKYIKLTRNKVAIVDDEDFEKINSSKWCYSGGYAMRMCNGKMTQMHRVILDTPIGFDTDHINRNKLDNRKDNLRIATRSQNSYNKPVMAKSISGYKGVSLFKRTGKWTAQICPNYKKIHLGYFNTPIEAAVAYDKKALEIIGDYASLNFPNAPR